MIDKTIFKEIADAPDGAVIRVLYRFGGVSEYVMCRKYGIRRLVSKDTHRRRTIKGPADVRSFLGDPLVVEIEAGGEQ